MNVWINIEIVYCYQNNEICTGMGLATGRRNVLNADVFIMIIISGQWAFIPEQWIWIFFEPTWRTSCSWCSQQLHWETPRWYRSFENIEGKFNLFNLVFSIHKTIWIRCFCETTFIKFESCFCFKSSFKLNFMLSGFVSAK